MTKSKNIINIFTEAVGLYFSNFSKFIKYMTFPVLGQILGLIIIFTTVYFYSKNIPFLIEKFECLNDFNTLILISILITLPGLIIFIKAFWEYLVAYGAINSMFNNMIKSGKVYDFDAHTELIKRRTVPYVGLWFLFGIFTLIAICPLFWVICGILAVYFVLIFQVFTFEPEQTPLGCVKRSGMLIKGHFAQTFILMALAGAITYLFIPQIFDKLFECTKINMYTSKAMLPIINQLPIPNLAQYGLSILDNEKITLMVTQTIFAQIFIQYTLPLRSILWSLWYKELAGKIEPTEVKKKRKYKRASEKLMAETNKKYSTKRLDKNILKRAAEKDDEE